MARFSGSSGSGIPANISESELLTLDGVVSAIQTQIDGKQAVVANVSNTEIGYLDGVTSAIQTQIDTKLATATAASTYQAINANVSTTELGYLDGVTSAIQTQMDAKAPSSTAVTLTDTQTLTNKTLTSPTINTAIFKDGVVRGLEEDVNVVASAATGTINIDVDTASIWYYTTNATANHTLNFRYSSSVSLNTALAIGDAITVVWLNTNGSTAYYPNAFQIDGNSVTPKVPAAITAGNASSIDAYSFTIIKTASATFTVLETQTKFA